MSTAHQTRCETCGRPLSPDAVEGLCELCLLESGWRGYRDDGGSDSPAPPSRWRTIGDYELTAEIARGGMGVVYRARQPSLDREVALKMILVGHWASPAQVERFRLEARASARLDHPHIVPILELGEHEGWHYFTMKLIDGEDLARQMSAGKWPAATRAGHERIAGLIQRVAEAVHFAHQRGILHRDLKPTNILVDRAGTPFVTDFGLAKLIEETSDITHTSAILGTPAYMAPEQAAGRTADITVAADIYSLGAVLYELLAGRPPYRAATPLETIRRVVETDITPLRKSNPAVDADLAVICAKCLRREAGDRYASAQDLADDLGRWRRREPIHAREVTPVEKLAYWARRNPLVAGLSGGLLLLILLAVVVSSTLAVRMREARDEARLNAAENRRRLASLLTDTGLKAAAAGDALSSLPWLVGALQVDAGDAARERPHRLRIASVLNELPELRALWFHERLIQHAAFSREGARVATASYDGTVRVWDVADGRELGPPRWHTNQLPGIDLLFYVAFSPDGNRVVSGGNRDARLWDVATGKLIGRPLAHTNEVRFAQFSPDGTRVLTASTDRAARVWDAATGDPATEPLRHELGVLTAAWSPDGRFVASGGRDRLVKVWEAATGRLVATTAVHAAEISHLEFSPNGQHFVSASRSPEVLVWRVADAGLAARLSPGGSVRHASFSPDGGRLLLGSTDRRAGIWDWRSAREQLVLPATGGVVWTGWSGDGRRVLTATASRLQVRDAVTGQALTAPLPHTQTITHAELSADGRFALVAGLDGTARVWDLSRLAPAAPEVLPVLRAFGPDDRYAVVQRNGATPVLWDVREQRELVPELPAAITNAYAVDFDQDARRLAVYREGKVTMFERPVGAEAGGISASFQETATWTGPERCTLRLTPDGRFVALFGPPEVRVYEALTGASVSEPLRHRAQIRHVAFSPDHRRILSVSDDATARVWELATGRAVGEVLTHDDVIVFGAFSPDGQQVVTTGYDGTARIWDAESGRERLPPLRHAGLVHAAMFSGDRRLLATVAAGNDVRVWRLEDGQPVTPPLPHAAGIHYAAFLEDDGPLLTVTDDLRFQLWELPAGHPLLVTTRMMTPVTTGSRLVEPWWQQLPVDERPLPELERESLLLTGRVVAGDGGALPVDTAALRRAWEEYAASRR